MELVVWRGIQASNESLSQHRNNKCNAGRSYRALTCARRCTRCWGYSSEPDKNPRPLGAYILEEEIDNKHIKQVLFYGDLESDTWLRRKMKERKGYGMGDRRLSFSIRWSEQRLEQRLKKNTAGAFQMNGEGSDITLRLEGWLAVDQARREDKQREPACGKILAGESQGLWRDGQKPIEHSLLSVGAVA